MNRPTSNLTTALVSAIVRHAAVAALGAIVLTLLAGWPTAFADSNDQVGPVTGFPMPRFVSVKTRPANVRAGPGRGYRILWTFVRRSLPVEVTAEYGHWRRIRDWDGKEGWIHGALISGRRFGVVAPWSASPTVPMRDEASVTAPIVAYLQRKVLVKIDSCDGKWCEVDVKSRRGYVRQTRLWGAYPGEHI
ncbi:MAG: SH3 domain-containing protein [Proteobacteria bacterium]|nr:SH3 domain-containing protein [Pseudomonadota bacterium]